MIKFNDIEIGDIIIDIAFSNIYIVTHKDNLVRILYCINSRGTLRIFYLCEFSEVFYVKFSLMQKYKR